MALVEREAQHKQVSKSAVIRGALIDRRGALIDRYIGRAMDAMWKAERETA
jgi:hypothetical protein